MRTAVTGSLATDRPMVTPGRFAERLLPDQPAHVAHSFSVDRLDVRRGGAAADDETTLLRGQWGLTEEPVETGGRPRLRGLPDSLRTENLLEAAVVHGCLQRVSQDDDPVVLDEAGLGRTRFALPRRRRGRGLCPAGCFHAGGRA
ncbi:hypothetical protein NFX46_25040 [Streptomyces phaeoluteigriseus]|uniref:Uncharacterized protein n=1 Tax=Streptomyces phaeoluteigriseus TaxID=114686 RepID=A0ABY4ZCJ7_9ACTN|nr:hypothetical protein [Streptomyces phaeoluteigriseus]USQ86681.1 hypothetical protein NFX46_25040 [Streptomyces phaeoluteigriseus]